MSSDREWNRKDGSVEVRGAEMLRRVFPMLAVLAGSGTQRDRSGNRRLLFSQYAGLMLVGLFNPIISSSRALVAASGLRNVRKLTGGKKVSLGAFSEATSVFEPHLLEGLVKQLRGRVNQQKHLHRCLDDGRIGDVPQELIDRLVAVDGSVLTALPQVVGRLGSPQKGQWKLHAQVRVLDRTLIESSITKEPSTGKDAEREVLKESVLKAAVEIPDKRQTHLFLMDRGYRSADLFNKLNATGHDYVCRLQRNDGRTLQRNDGRTLQRNDGRTLQRNDGRTLQRNDGRTLQRNDGRTLQRNDGRTAEAKEHTSKAATAKLPPLSDEAVSMGIIADELITMGGNCGASKVQTDHPVRRITVTSSSDRRDPASPNAARQGRVRTDRDAGDQFILATTLLDIPAEQVILLYEYRWQVELFFRFLKHVLKCETLLSAKTSGVQIQLYCAMIAALLFALVTGNNLSKRNFEMICLFYAGWAEEDELLEALQKQTSKPP
jgi:hypothetical protein